MTLARIGTAENEHEEAEEEEGALSASE